ncbi:hypothetical protein BHM03_00056908 [Ensete ventricosum]|nr:hypothetical protein BHM03_00056908 [Ensete ventricosum]
MSWAKGDASSLELSLGGVVDGRSCDICVLLLTPKCYCLGVIDWGVNTAWFGPEGIDPSEVPASGQDLSRASKGCTPAPFVRKEKLGKSSHTTWF